MAAVYVYPGASSPPIVGTTTLAGAAASITVNLDQTLLAMYEWLDFEAFIKTAAGATPGYVPVVLNGASTNIKFSNYFDNNRTSTGAGGGDGVALMNGASMDAIVTGRLRLRKDGNNRYGTFRMTATGGVSTDVYTMRSGFQFFDKTTDVTSLGLTFGAGNFDIGTKVTIKGVL